MKRWSIRTPFVYSMMALMAAAPVAVQADGNPAQVEISEIPRTDSDADLTPPDMAQQGEGDYSESLPAAWADASFERYVDLGQVSVAIARHDAALLTDIGLQLAEGERILMRSHQSGLSSKKLLATAARLAATTQDKGTLERLARAAKSSGDASLQEKVQAAQQLSGTSRAADPSLAVALDQTSLDTVTELKSWLDVVQEATVVGDTMALQALQSAVDDSVHLTDSQKAAVSRQIEEGLATIPAPDSEDPLLIQLSGTSRTESDRTAVRARIAAGGWYVVWGKTIAAGDYVALVASIASGTVGAYFGALLEQNIAKMQSQLPGVAKSVLIDAFKRAMKGSAIIRVGKLGIKGGIATYRYWNVITVKVPNGTEKYKIKGPFGTWTWGYRPVFKTVTKQVPAEPNNHQPYFAFRTF